MCLVSQTNDATPLFNRFSSIFNLEDATLWGPSDAISIIYVSIHRKKKMWCLPGDKVGKSDVDFAKSACLILPKAYHPRFKQGTITTGVQYTPKMGDIVVGIISAKFADGFRVRNY